MIFRRRSLVGFRVGDVALGVAAVVGIVAATRRVEPSSGDRALDAVAYGCMAVVGVSLVGRRRWPLMVLAVVTGALAVYLARGYPGGPVFLALFVALYTLATARGWRFTLGAGAVAAGVLLVVGEVADTSPGFLVHLVFVGWAAAAVFLGDGTRSRRAHVAALEAHAAYLERSRELEARRRVAEERLRIAQDLHDSVAHTMTTINVQAGVAAHVIERQPARARDALVVIQRVSGEVLDGLAELLGLLRLDQADGAPLTPPPSPAELGALVESAADSGLDVTLRVERGVDDVSLPVGAALYRIVQESLTNVVRHAGADATAQVTVTDDGEGGLCVEVVDDGVGFEAAVSGGGAGIIGMRERAVATGGVLEVAAGRRGGCMVRAIWPSRA